MGQSATPVMTPDFEDWLIYADWLDAGGRNDQATKLRRLVAELRSDAINISDTESWATPTGLVIIEALRRHALNDWRRPDGGHVNLRIERPSDPVADGFGDGRAVSALPFDLAQFGRWAPMRPITYDALSEHFDRGRPLVEPWIVTATLWLRETLWTIGSGLAITIEAATTATNETHLFWFHGPPRW